MRVGIIDADLLYRPRQRFPNLACMKISGFYKREGHRTELIQDYKEIRRYDRLFLFKVFTDTYVPNEILQLENLTYGGTGFYYDKAPPLPEEMEHGMPDYELYQDYIQGKMQPGKSKAAYKFYTDYSIGFLTRGCFRQCEFCVNKNSKRSVPASPLEEFMDSSRKKLCFLDDNFLACREWERLLDSVLETGKRFQFRQGLNLRIMQESQMKKLFSGKLDDTVLFAFDDIRDRDVIERKLDLLNRAVPVHKRIKFYVLCGFDRAGLWKPDFWGQDIRDTLERARILMRYKCLAYIMRYEKCWQSPYRGMYITISRWCNQPAQYIPYRNRHLTRHQKECFIRKYRAGKIHKSPKSWEYKSSLQALKRLQEEYIFWAEHDIRSIEGLSDAKMAASERMKEVREKKRELEEEKKPYQAVLHLLGELEPLQMEAELYKEGYPEFSGEFLAYEAVCQKLEGLGYSVPDARRTEAYFQTRTQALEEEKRQAIKEKRIAERLLSKVYSRERGKSVQHEIQNKGL